MSHYVYLNTKYDEYYVDEAAYAQIAALVQQHKQCTYDYHDHHPYTQENPCVGNNMCLTHALKKYSRLTYTGQSGKREDGLCVYRFVDQQGYVYLSTEDSTRDMQRSISETLAYYGFTPPATVTARGKTSEFYPHYATLYGDLKTASVMVLSYNQTSEKVKGLFLLYKNGPTKELMKRSDLYTRAEEVVEASKDARGEYHIGGNSHSGRFDADVYEVISQLESAMYDVTVRLKNGHQGTDNRTGGQDAQKG